MSGGERRWVVVVTMGQIHTNYESLLIDKCCLIIIRKKLQNTLRSYRSNCKNTDQMRQKKIRLVDFGTLIIAGN